MPNKALLYQNGKNVGLAGTTSGQVLGWNGTDWVATSVPYDFSGEFPTSPEPNEVIYRFIAVRPFTIKNSAGATISKAYADTPASATTVFTFKKDGTAFATITFASGSNEGTVAITDGVDFAVAAGERITGHAPPTTTNGIGYIYWTFFAVQP